MNTIRGQLPLPEDLRVFLTVIRKRSFAAAAEELGQSPAYVSKRIGVLERKLQARLFHRTTRRVTLTDDGHLTQRAAERVLNEVDALLNDLSEVRRMPRGLLHVCSSFGFGRNHVAPALAQFAEQYPQLEVRLDVFDRIVDIVSEGFDMEIRVGDDLPSQHVSKRLVSNRRVLCAAPDYLRRRGTPTSLEELGQHDCLIIKERNNAFGVWQLERDGRTRSVRIGGPLSSNNGEIVLQWALHGRGVILRSMWDVGPMLECGELERVLPEYSQRADVWAVYPLRAANSAKLRVCVEFLEQHFRQLALNTGLREIKEKRS